ncbi:aspartyl-phosphate phosphatase Spo0E family protein [Neobacillus notoginsengisoli]
MEAVRKKMLQSIKLNGLSSKVTLSISQELDELIVEVQRRRMSNRA